MRLATLTRGTIAAAVLAASLLLPGASPAGATGGDHTCFAYAPNITGAAASPGPAGISCGFTISCPRTHEIPCYFQTEGRIDFNVGRAQVEVFAPGRSAVRCAAVNVDPRHYGFCNVQLWPNVVLGAGQSQFIQFALQQPSAANRVTIMGTSWLLN